MRSSNRNRCPSQINLLTNMPNPPLLFRRRAISLLRDIDREASVKLASCRLPTSVSRALGYSARSISLREFVDYFSGQGDVAYFQLTTHVLPCIVGVIRYIAVFFLVKCGYWEAMSCNCTQIITRGARIVFDLSWNVISVITKYSVVKDDEVELDEMTVLFWNFLETWSESCPLSMYCPHSSPVQLVPFPLEHVFTPPIQPTTIFYPQENNTEGWWCNHTATEAK